MSGERLVRDFGELQAGMIVIGECDCGRRHRGLLLGKTFTGRGDGYPLVPTPTCTYPGQRYGVDAADVASRRVFIVEDGLSASIQETAKRRTPARSR